jgi:hypothetical protein
VIDPSISSEAVALMMGDRNRTHGNPEETLKRIAAIWSGFLDIELTPSQVSSMMALLKIARARHAYDRDHYVDAVAYLLLAEGMER